MKFPLMKIRRQFADPQEATHSSHGDGKSELLALIVALLIIGLFAIAMIDTAYRPVFADLAKVGVAGYIGWAMPRVTHH